MSEPPADAPAPIEVPAVLVLESAEAAASLLNPLRRRILEHLATADSASGVGRHLRLPRQKVNYHLRELERRGLVRLVAEERRGNVTERIVVAAARSFALSPKVFGRLSADRKEDPSPLAQWTAALQRALRDLAVTPEDHAPRFLELDIRLPNDEARREFIRQVEQIVRHLERKYAHSEGVSHRVVAAVQRSATFDARFGEGRPGEGRSAGDRP